MVLTTGMTVFANRPVKLYVGGEIVKLDVKPQIVEGRTMVPVRACTEAFGLQVDWYS